MLHALQDYWHQLSWLEVIAVITGLLCVYLAAINNIWNWPIAVISTVITVYIMADKALYADMLQYTYLTFINIYGWYLWSQKKDGNIQKPVTRINVKQALSVLLSIVFITPVLGYVLITFAAKLHYQPPAFPYLDSFCTVVSLAAQVLLARKVLENWLMWIFVDSIYIVIYALKGLEAYAFMFAIYIIIALVGYIDWRKNYRIQKAALHNSF